MRKRKVILRFPNGYVGFRLVKFVACKIDRHSFPYFGYSFSGLAICGPSHFWNRHCAYGTLVNQLNHRVFHG